MDFTWDETRAAVQAGMVAASGLPSAAVIWKYQKGGQPVTPYIAMHIGSSRRRGVDYLTQGYDPARPPAQAIEIANRGIREVALELEAFTASVADKDDALALLDRVESCIQLPDIRSIFTDVGFTPFGPGPINYVPAIVSTGFRGRGVMTIRSLMPAVVYKQFVTFIQRLGINIDVHGTTPDPKHLPIINVDLPDD